MMTHQSQGRAYNRSALTPKTSVRTVRPEMFRTQISICTNLFRPAAGTEPNQTQDIRIRNIAFCQLTEVKIPHTSTYVK